MIIRDDEVLLLFSREARMREMLSLDPHAPYPMVKIEAWLILRSYCGNPYRVWLWVTGKVAQFFWWEVCALGRRLNPSGLARARDLDFQDIKCAGHRCSFPTKVGPCPTRVGKGYLRCAAHGGSDYER